ncbi:MAG: hypothetical protein JXB08_01910 [Bacilli bacterium]|nr:hypothetical protein [Bacilli bacterium]MBN2876032.1 hypothetical protein [Bacilli bacterium]
MRLLVIGACNIDLIGTTLEPVIPHESNIGHISISLGGVAKNIATNLYNLGADIAFLTILGADRFANLQEKELTDLGIDFSHSFRKDSLSSTYLAVHDSNGEMVTGVNDMRAFETLTIEEFKPLDDYIKSFDVLIFDTNLRQEVLEYLIQTYKDKLIYVDGVSQTKVVRIQSVLPFIDLLKINNYELNSLLDIENCDIIYGVKQLIQRGVKHCMVSSANEPITYNIEENIYQSITHKMKEIKSTMGAGDALLSGTIFYLIHGKNMHEAINFGKIVATKTLEVYEACNDNIKELIDL